MAGFVYIMSNPSFVSGRIKIGKSDRDPEEFRKFELESTGVPEPFKVEYYACVVDHHRIERSLHRAFGYARANKQREFFDVPSWKVIDEIRKIAEIMYEINNCADAQIQTLAATCAKCSTPFSVIVEDRGEWELSCPECDRSTWYRYNFATEQFVAWT